MTMTTKPQGNWCGFDNTRGRGDSENVSKLNNTDDSTIVFEEDMSKTEQNQSYQRGLVYMKKVKL